MIKLFEHYSQDFDYYFNKCDSDVVGLLHKIKDFFESILVEGHNIRIDSIEDGENKHVDFFLDIVNEKKNIMFTTKFYHKDNKIFINHFIIYDGLDIPKGIYLLLVAYFKMEISKVTDKIELTHPFELKFYYTHITKDKIDKINFSKEDYEAFKDAERFGL